MVDAPELAQRTKAPQELELDWVGLRAPQGPEQQVRPPEFQAQPRAPRRVRLEELPQAPALPQARMEPVRTAVYLHLAAPMARRVAAVRRPRDQMAAASGAAARL